jgi:hypothetical protein
METDTNIKITKAELRFIRTLQDFDLTMFLSEVHDHGWPVARKLLPMIKECTEKVGQRRTKAT